MTIGHLVAKLIATGTPPEVAAEVVAEVFAAGVLSVRPQTSADESVTSRKEKDRIRQKIRRDNLRISADVHGNPQTSADYSLSKSIKEEIKEEREACHVTSRDNWRPPSSEWDDAVAKLGGEAAVVSELVKFRERPGSMARILPDWRVWVQRAVDWQAKNKPTTATAAANGEIVEDDKFWESAIWSWKKFSKWPARNAGPDPDSPACRCPPDLLKKHGLRQEAG